MRPIKHPSRKQLTLTALLYALSDPTRMGIVQALASAPGPGLPCSALLGERPKSSMSHHFKILREAGVIETTVEGTEHLNRLRTADVEDRFPGVLKSILRALGKPR